MGYVNVSYCSPNRISSQFDNFLPNFEKLSDDVQIFQATFTVILGDFRAWSKSWWSGHSTTIEVTRLDSLVSPHSFHQLISEPMHIAKFTVPRSP